MVLNVKNPILAFTKEGTQKYNRNCLDDNIIFTKVVKQNKESPASAETDSFYCPEALGSLWPVAMDFLELPSSKISQLRHWRDLF